MEAIVKELLCFPDAKELIRQAQEALIDEERRRRQFYETVTEQVKVEFINGEIVTQSPVRLRHTDVGGLLYILMRMYANRQKLGFVGYEKMLVRLTRNDYEPDIAFFKQERAANFRLDQMFFPAPDLVVEVLSSSTERIDRDVKFRDYALHGVDEYWLIDSDTETVEIYRLAGQQYELFLKTDCDEINSRPLTGFSIPVRAIFDELVHTATLARLLDAEL